MLTIRVIAYWGDLDTEREIYIVGPYTDTASRDAGVEHLAALPGAFSLAGFEHSRVDPQAADGSCTAAEAATAKTFDEVLDIFDR